VDLIYIDPPIFQQYHNRQHPHYQPFLAYFLILKVLPMYLIMDTQLLYQAIREKGLKERYLKILILI
jgi:hypothetical protein